MTTITKERLLTIQQWREIYGPGSNVVLPAEEAEELARIALASLDAEPVAWQVTITKDGQDSASIIYRDCAEKDTWVRIHETLGSVVHVTPLYMAPPAAVVPDDNRIQFSVSLPAAFGGDKYFIDGVFQPLRYERDCEKAVVAAGGVVNWIK